MNESTSSINLTTEELSAGLPSNEGEPTRTESGPLDEFNVFEILKADHDRLAALFTEINTETDSEKISASFKELNNLLLAHTAAEEEAFYPAAHQFPDEAGQVDKNYEQHAEAKELLEEAATLELGSESFNSCIRNLQAALENHVHEEENYLFRGLQGEMSEAQLQTLASQVREARDRFGAQYGAPRI